MKLFFLSIIFILFIFIPSSILSQPDSLVYLIEGKKALNARKFDDALLLLNKALAEYKEIGDYILFWRAKAYKETQKYEEALKDLENIRKNFSKSPLTKEVRKEEIELTKKINEQALKALYDSFIRDYPEDLSIKYEYASYLKNHGDIITAKKLFKEIFISASPLSYEAEKELSANDITVYDIIKKAKNLNNAYQFKKAEKYLREALKNCSGSQKKEILSSLGYSLFMQKKYKESAEVFKEAHEEYWRARALIRAKDFESFEKELKNLIRINDPRIADVLINYANIKRRAGDTEGAIKILRMAISQYPSSKEDALWLIAWNYYLSGSYESAKKTLSELYSSYGKLKYLYWIEKIKEKKELLPVKELTVSFIPGDIYSYLFFAKGKISQKSEAFSRGKAEGANVNHFPELNHENVASKPINLPPRIDILIKAGFKEEALKEIKYLITENKEQEKIPFYCQLLYYLGDYPTSVRLISKIPNGYNYQELLYPYAYKDLVFEAAKKFRVDPYLIFAIIREESRFDRQAVSPAGAFGLMQLMPETAKRISRKIGSVYLTENDIFNPEKNIMIGTAYLKELIDEFGSITLAIAAYNAGEKAVRDWISSYNYNEIDEFMEDIPYYETKKYVQKVLTSYAEYLRTSNELNQERLAKIIKYKGGD